MRRLIYVGQDDDISDLAGRLQSAAEGDEVGLVVPQGAQSFQSPLHLRLLRQLGAKRGHEVALVTPDPRLQEQAREAGLGAFSSVPAFESGVPVGPARPPADPAGGSPGGAPPPPGTSNWPFRAAGAGAPEAAVPSPGGGRAPGPAPPGEAVDTPWGRPAAPVTPAGDDTPTLPPWARTEPPPGATGAPPGGVEFEPAPAVPGTGTAWPVPRQGWPARGPAQAWPGEPEETATPLGWDAAGTAGLGDTDPYMAGGTATAVAAPPARPQAAAAERGGPRPGAPGPPRRRGRWRPGAPLYFVLAGIAVVGILLYLALSPTADVTVVVAEQPLTVNPLIQGSSAAVPAGQKDQIQTRVVTASGTQQFTATPTGTKTVAAAPATGQIVFSATQGGLCYAQGCSFPLSQGSQFKTGSGIIFSVSTTTDIVVPASGGVSNAAPVTAVAAGSSGNVPNGSITQWVCDPTNPVCQQDEAALQVNNPQATTGGTDPAQETVASSSDIQGWQNQVTQFCAQLTSKVQGDLTTKAGTGKIAQAPDQGGETVSCRASPDVTKLSPGDQMAQKSETVTVTAGGQATVYNPADIERVVYADLKASSNLPQGDTLVSTKPKLTNLDIIQAASDGTLSISVTGTGFYRPAALDLNSVRGQLTGHNPSDVPGIIEKQLGDVQSVTVSEHPFTLFYMPFFASNIHITQRYVTQSTSTAAT